jgi:VCBS repeat protein
MRARGSAVLLASIGVALLLGAAARSAARHAPSFAQAKSYATGNGPAPTVADLNGDGRPDLVTANYRANTVSVLLNRGRGALGARKDYATGREPFSVAIGDLNGDGKADLVAQLDEAAVSILLNSGDGSFGAKRDYPTNELGSSLPVVADLTADGKADLVTYNEGDTVSVLLNRGDGTFEPARNYATGRGVSSLAVDDLNGDGRPDLATANTRASTVSVLVNRGDGSFAPKRDLRTARSPFSVKTRDLNGDRKLDIVTANFGGISVLRNKGGGSFGAHRDYPNCRPCFADSKPDFASIETADLNRDGKPDVVTRNDDELEHEEYGVSCSVFLNKGNGTFKRRTATETLQPIFPAPGSCSAT